MGQETEIQVLDVSILESILMLWFPRKTHERHKIFIYRTCDGSLTLKLVRST